jgi:hypothetical protein
MKTKRNKGKRRVLVPDWGTEFMCLKACLGEQVIGHETAVETIGGIMASQAIRGKVETESVAPRVLLVSGTGMGKTFIVSQVARILNLPSVTVNFGLLSPEGYKGSNLSSALKTLVADGGLDGLNRVQKSSILFLEEIDKTLRRKDDWIEQLQYASLPSLGGETVTIESDDGYEPPKMISTKNILVFGGGVFPTIKPSAWSKVETAQEALLKSGFCFEWVSRWTHFIYLNKLPISDVQEIIRREVSRNQILYQSDQFTPTINEREICRLSLKVLRSKFGMRHARALVHERLFSLAKEHHSIKASYR